MSIVLPTFSPVKPHSFVDTGVYVADDSTLDQMSTLKVTSDIKPSGTSSFVVRCDVRKNSAVAGLPDVNIAGYFVFRGDLADFTLTEKLDIVNRVALVLTSSSGANITRIERGER